jgi:hypothetical protein
VLSEEEANWMAHRFREGGQAYQDMLNSLEPSNVSLDVMRHLPAVNTRVSNLLRDASIMAENTVRGRFLALNSGLSRKQAQIEQKRPIRDRMLNMDLEVKVKTFHPLFLRGRQFRLEELVVQALQNGDPEARAEALRESEVFCNAEPDANLRALAVAWFRQALTA